MASTRVDAVTRPALALSTGKGFTLIEVMVALVIVSLGMMAVKSQLNNYARTAGFMEEKTLASWIGSNVITNLSIQPEWPELGESTEDIDFAGRSWSVEIVVSETEVENLRRVDVSVSHIETPDSSVHRISGLIEPPAPPGFVPVQWFSGGSGG